MMKNWNIAIVLIGACVLANATTVFGQCPIEVQDVGDTLLICENTSVVLTATGGSNYAWQPSGDFSDPNSATTQFTPTASGWYFVEGEVNAMICRDSFYVDLVDTEFDIILSETDSVCQDEGVIATIAAAGPISNIVWEDASAAIPVGMDSFLLMPSTSGNFTVEFDLANCRLSGTAPVLIIPFELEANVADTAFLCLNDSLRVNVSTSPSNMMISWEPDDSTVNWMPGQNSAWLKPIVSTSYAIIGETAKCADTLEFLVRVDSLPDLTLNLVVEKPFYCAGEIVTIYSERADSIRYPDIVFQWMPDDGQIQDSTNTENVAIILQDTTLFRRITTNNACMDTSEIMINVIPPVIPLSLTDTMLCPGESFTVEVLDPDIENLEWSPPTGLSCTTCPNPTVTAQTTRAYTVSGGKEGCPMAGSLNVFVKGRDNMVFGYDPDPPFGQGQTVNVTAVLDPPPAPGTVFTWTVNGEVLDETTQTVPVTLTELNNNTISVAWINSNGCPQSAQILVNTIPPDIKIPNAFTPNNDDLNDMFRPVIIGGAELREILVFNRWGQLVYEGSDPDGWDGRFEGEFAPADVYVYVMKFELPNGQVETRKGDVSLIR